VPDIGQDGAVRDAVAAQAEPIPFRGQSRRCWAMVGE
jgi:hypothetical protein